MTAKIGSFEIRSDRRYAILMRHLQQVKSPGAKAVDWLPTTHLNMDVAVPQAALIRSTYLNEVPIAKAYCSFLVRTLQTIALVMPQAPMIEKTGMLTPPDYMNTYGRWNYLADLKGETAAECEAANPHQFMDDGETAADFIASTMTYDAGDGDVFAFVTHNPIGEAIWANFLGGVDKLPVPNLGKGDIVLMEFDQAIFCRSHHLPVPSSSSASGSHTEAA